MGEGIGLTLTEIHGSFDSDALRSRFPAILTPAHCAEMFSVSVNTVYFWLDQNQLPAAHRRRGKRQLIWRDRAILRRFNGSIGDNPTLPRSRGGEAGIGLTDAEINAAFAAEAVPANASPILSSEGVAKLLGMSRSTIYFWIQE